MRDSPATATFGASTSLARLFDGNQRVHACGDRLLTRGTERPQVLLDRLQRTRRGRWSSRGGVLDRDDKTFAHGPKRRIELIEPRGVREGEQPIHLRRMPVQAPPQFGLADARVRKVS